MQNPILQKMQMNNPNQLFNQLMQRNPQFRNFVNQNKGKTPEQIASENGIDINLLQQFMNKK